MLLMLAPGRAGAEATTAAPVAPPPPASAAAAAAAAAEDTENVAASPEGPVICLRNVPTIEKLEAQLKREGLPVVYEEGMTRRYSDRLRYTTWAFTLVRHPAHPSVVCRTVIGRDDRPDVHSEVLCGAEAAGCEWLIKDTMWQDDLLRARMRGTPEPPRPGG